MLLNSVYALLVEAHSGSQEDRDDFEDWLASDPAAEEALARLLT